METGWAPSASFCRLTRNLQYTALKPSPSTFLLPCCCRGPGRCPRRLLGSPSSWGGGAGREFPRIPASRRAGLRGPSALTDSFGETSKGIGGEEAGGQRDLGEGRPSQPSPAQGTCSGHGRYKALLPTPLSTSLTSLPPPTAQLGLFYTFNRINIWKCC